MEEYVFLEDGQEVICVAPSYAAAQKMVSEDAEYLGTSAELGLDT